MSCLRNADSSDYCNQQCIILTFILFELCILNGFIYNMLQTLPMKRFAIVIEGTVKRKYVDN